MYKGTNTIAIQSQQWLANALIELLQNQDYQKITIKDICHQADLSRQTFYNVFNSKEEVLHYYLQNTYLDSFQKLKESSQLSAYDVVDAFIKVIEQNYELLKNMINNHLTGILSEEIVYGVDLFTDAFVLDNNKNEMFPYNKAMVAGAFSQVLIYWLEQKDPISIQSLSSLLTDFLTGRTDVFAQ